MKAWLFAFVAALFIAGTAWAQTPAPSCEEELGQMRYLVRLFGETRTQAEFEVAKQRARADRAEAEAVKLRQLVEAWRKLAPADLPGGQNMMPGLRLENHPAGAEGK